MGTQRRKAFRNNTGSSCGLTTLNGSRPASDCDPRSADFLNGYCGVFSMSEPNPQPNKAQERTAADVWQVFRVMSEYVEGFEALSQLPAAVSVFGSARTKPDDKYYKDAEAFGAALVKRGFAVITGGGPGIMEAANKGAM